MRDAGHKSWLLRYTLSGQARQMGFGDTGLVSLAEAREAALEARKLASIAIFESGWPGLPPGNSGALDRLRSSLFAGYAIEHSHCRLRERNTMLAACFHALAWDGPCRGSHFVWASTSEGVVSLTPAQLAMLTEGIDWRAPVRTWRPKSAG